MTYSHGLHARFEHLFVSIIARVSGVVTAQVPVYLRDLNDAWIWTTSCVLRSDPNRRDTGSAVSGTGKLYHFGYPRTRETEKALVNPQNGGLLDNRLTSSCADILSAGMAG